MSASTSTGARADVGGHREPGRDAALEPRDAHHEELVEVRREDREEVGALQQREGVVFGEFEHALVEGEPAQLAVEVAVLGQRAVIHARRFVEVVLIERIGRRGGLGELSVNGCVASIVQL